MSPSDWLEHEILVAVGTGGVGKTTVGAAIGLEAARRGKRTLLLTIDPARRLADALGVGPLDHREREIPRELLAAAGVAGSGSLSAMMLDTKRTFDELVMRYAPSPDTVERIFQNPIYQNLTDALSGSREYSAMEKLYEIHSRGSYDLIVLDTPPASHALDFLDAPRRLTLFLDSQLLKLLFRPALAIGRTSFRLFQMGSNTVLQLMERITGLEFLRTVAEFLLAFESMLAGFTSRAADVELLLHSQACGFVLVTGPDAPQIERARELFSRLQDEQIHLAGLVVNRVRTWPAPGPIPSFSRESYRSAREGLMKAFQSRQPPFDPKHAAESLLAAVKRRAILAARDEASANHLAESVPLPRRSIRTVPLFSEDVHALDALGRMSGHLFHETTDG